MYVADATSALGVLVAPLYANETRLRAVVDSVLGGHLGDVAVDNRSQPRVARLRLGCYAIFAGDAAQPAAAELLAGNPASIEFIVPRHPPWTALLMDLYGGRLIYRPMQAYAANAVDLSRLRKLADQTPASFQIRQIDANLAAQLNHRLLPNGMDVMVDPSDFAARSGGVGAVIDGKLVCAATNYAFAHNAIELAIATDTDYRGMGLATCVAATWTRQCLQRGVTPHWNASNPVSQRLALRLGYAPTETVEVWYLPQRSD